MTVPNTMQAGPVRQVDEKPLIFLSHDTSDADIAASFSKLLRDSSAGTLECFRSTDCKGDQGFEYGDAWYRTLEAKIQSASAVICLLTLRSFERPWILFEAGLAKGKTSGSVFGVALGISVGRASTGPFGWLHNCPEDEEALTKLIMQLMELVPNAAPDPTTIKTHVREFKTTVSDVLRMIEDKNNQATNWETFSNLGLQRIQYLRDENLQERLESAKKIKILKTWFPETLPIEDGLKAAVERGAEVRLLLSDPDSELLKQRSTTALRARNQGSQVVYRAIESILQWVGSSELTVEIGLYDSWPGCPVIWYDQNILMGFYFRRAPSPEWPWVSVRDGSDLANILEAQFRDLWATAHQTLKTKDDIRKWLDDNSKWRELVPG